jgi:DNA-binding NarL/FixJ family response regulator
MDEPINICVVADDPLARAGLASLLGTFPQLVIAIQGSQALLPEMTGGFEDTDIDVVIWDLGWEAIPEDADEILGQAIPTVVLVQDEDQASTAWQLGLRGLLFRDFNPDQLYAAIVAVIAGLTVLAPGLTRSLNDSLPSSPDELFIELTARETEVLSLLAEGLTNKAIGYRLSISDHTVKFHVNAIMGKLEAQSRTDAVVRATRLGLITL